MLPAVTMMRDKISGRLILAIITTLLEESALVAVVLWVLPRIGVQMPLWGSIVLLITLMLAWGTWTITTYRKGSHVLQKEPLIGLPNMVGSTGKVVSALAPDGLVKIRGELWIARPDSGEVDLGKEVVVVEQNKLKLVVRESEATRV